MTVGEQNGQAPAGHNPLYPYSAAEAKASSEPTPLEPRAPRVERRIKWVDVPTSNYRGFKIRIWTNFPQRLLDQATGTTDEEEAAAMMSRIVLEHNGWRDEDDNVFPPTNDPAFWSDIPFELRNAITAIVIREASELPTLIREQKKR